MTCLFVGAYAGPDANKVPPKPGANRALPKAEQRKVETAANQDGFDWTKGVFWVIGLPASLLAIVGLGKIVGPRLAWRRHRRDYKKVLRAQLGSIQILGCPGINTIPVALLDTFVDLTLSSGREIDPPWGDNEGTPSGKEPRGLSSRDVVEKAFRNHRMLLIVGDPGSGKSTLVRYYAMCCLTERLYARLGLAKRPWPLYLPLSAASPAPQEPKELPERLARWAQTCGPRIPADRFEKWLQGESLVLLDGLDEISDPRERQKVCGWIDRSAAWFEKARFIVTSRGTGYRKADGIELPFDHLRADVQDFRPEQQRDFLLKWFRMVSRQTDSGWRTGHARTEGAEQKAAERAEALFSLLQRPENVSLRQLAAVPMLLQIMAILWEQLRLPDLPRTRAAVFDVALPYLLEYRDLQRDKRPLLSAKAALSVLRPVSLWMQETLRSETVDKTELHGQMRPILHAIDHTISAEDFCANLCDRAGLIGNCGDEAYIFRHKSFREYLAGWEFVDRARENPGRLNDLVGYFHTAREWWREPLRFFMAHVDRQLSNRFMDAFFTTGRTEDIDPEGALLLETLTREAASKPTESLITHLNAEGLTAAKKGCILNCLKIIASPEAIQAVREFGEREGGTDIGKSARQIVLELSGQTRIVPDETWEATMSSRGVLSSFRNPYELNAQYVLIPSGEYLHDVTRQRVRVQAMCFAKFPVTNKRYRAFLAYLAGQAPELQGILPVDRYRDLLSGFGSEVPGLGDYLGPDPGQWPDKLRSTLDEDRRFGGDDQPVVGVSWFGAKAYCLWLSELARAGDASSVESGQKIFRLPDEAEWVWAAFGREPGGGLREYPWPAEKGKPNDKLANYSQNVGATTPVGRYPEGATPEGLMDMAGNVWEWMENRYGHKDYPETRSLRGGSWNYYVHFLSRSIRLFLNPEYRLNYVGFRVVCSQL